MDNFELSPQRTRVLTGRVVRQHRTARGLILQYEGGTYAYITSDVMGLRFDEIPDIQDLVAAGLYRQAKTTAQEELGEK